MPRLKHALLPSAALGAVALLSACATSQENPNYKYSTTYKGATPYQASQSTVIAPTVQSAGYEQTVTTPQPYTQPYTQQQVQASTPAPTYTPAPIQAPQPIAPSPTEMVFADQDMTGTPGYLAMQNQEPVEMADVGLAAAPVYQPTTTQPLSTMVVTPQPVQQPVHHTGYGYGGLYDEPGTISASTQTPLAGLSEFGGVPQFGGSYTIKEGEHLWPIKTELCVDLADIKALNPNLDAKFNVWPGDVIQLPASRCS